MADCTIHVYGPASKIQGNYPLGPIRKATSYEVEGAKFSKAYKRGIWDGRTHLFDKKHHTFPTGLLGVVTSVLDVNQVTYEVVDHRVIPDPVGRSFELQGVSMDGKYSYQLDACQKMVAKKQGVVRIATNGGKGTIGAAVTSYLGLKTLFVVPSRELLHQQRARFMTTLALNEREVGIIGDGSWSPGTFITVALIPTLESRMDTKECQDFLKEVQVLFLDECFPMGTQIRTPEGLVSIEDVKVGDEVCTLSGTGFVSRVVCSDADNRSLVRVKTAKSEFVCTEAHPIWTDRGWVPAMDLPEGVVLPCTYGRPDVLQGGLVHEDVVTSVVRVEGTSLHQRGSDVFSNSHKGSNTKVYNLSVEDDPTYVLGNGVVVHNCHHLGSETWYTLVSLCPASYRYGLSGTPLDRTDGGNLRLVAATGGIIVDIPNKTLVELGVSVKAEIIVDKITQPIIPDVKGKKTAYATAYKQGVSENPLLVERIVDWTKVFMDLGLSTLILIEEIEHGKLIDEALWSKTGGMFIPHQFIHGSEDGDTRSKALLDFSEKRLPVMISSTILDEGVDCPAIDAIILAGSRKSRIKTMQRLGRGLRGDKLVMVEFANFCHKYLADHSIKRIQDYKKEDCFGITLSGPDKDLVVNLLARQAAYRSSLLDRP